MNYYLFDIWLAEEYGVNEAIMIANLSYWIDKNRASGKHFYDGKTWTYNSMKAFTLLFPFWNYNQVRNVLQSLIKKGVIISGNYNTNQYDRTAWYAFVDESRFLISDKSKCKNSTFQYEKIPNGKCEFSHSNIDTNNKPDINTDIDSLGASAPTQPKDNSFNDFFNQQPEKQLEAHTIASNNSRLPTQQEGISSHSAGKKVAFPSIPEGDSKVAKMQSTGRRIEWYIESRKDEDVTNENCPDDLGNWAIKEFKWNTDKVIREWEKFCDYWTAKSGAQARKANWPGTWRNWCRKTADDEERYNNKQWSKK